MKVAHGQLQILNKAAVLKVGGRDVYRKSRRISTKILPFGKLLARMADDPGAQGGRQPALMGRMQQVGRRQVTSVGLAAQQRFITNDRPAPQANRGW